MKRPFFLLDAQDLFTDTKRSSDGLKSYGLNKPYSFLKSNYTLLALLRLHGLPLSKIKFLSFIYLFYAGNTLI